MKKEDVPVPASVADVRPTPGEERKTEKRRLLVFDSCTREVWDGLAPHALLGFPPVNLGRELQGLACPSKHLPYLSFFRLILPCCQVPFLQGPA